MWQGKRIIASVLVFMIILGLVPPDTVRADDFISNIGFGITNAASKPNQPSISGDQDSVAISYGDKITLTDDVRYTNLTVGKTYVIEGKLYELTVDEKGSKTVNDTGISSSKTFTVPDSPRAKASGDGETKLNGGVISQKLVVENLEKLRSKDYVIFETLKCEDNVISKLEQLKDQSRYVKTPSFTSSIVDSENGTRLSLADSGKSVKIIVNHTDLVPNTEYYCNARLVKRGGAGTDFTLGEAKFAFVPAKANDSFEKSINYLVLPKVGDTVQLLYEISTDGEESGEALVYRMNDNTIEENRLYVTSFSLNVKDIKTGAAVSEYSKKATTRVTLNYENIPYGKVTVTTSLYDASTNKILNGSNGKPCKKTESFFAVIKDSSYSADFTFDSTALAGRQLYAAITVSTGNKVIYTADSKANNNRMYIASVTSKLLSFASGAHMANLDGSYESIKDMISYNNLLSGNKYSVESVLINAKTKARVNTSAKSEFTAFNSIGEVANIFGNLVYSGLLGSTLQSHVNLYMNDVLVASSRTVPKDYSGISIPKPTATPKPTSTPKPTKKPAAKKSSKSKKKKSATVYWTEYGECYHRRLSCISRSRYYYKGTVSEAISWGYRPCKKCAR